MKNLCYNPFTGLDISTQGNLKPCCKFLGNKMPTFNVENGIEEYQQSEWLSNLQKEFLDGGRPIGCQNCWKEEDAGVKSKRQLDYISHKEEFDHIDHDIEKPLIVAIDELFNNELDWEYVTE